MKIKVNDLGKGTLKDNNGNIYIADSETVYRESDNKEFTISEYDEYDNVTEITE